MSAELILATTGRVYSLGWRAQAPMEQGIALTYSWIEEQVKKARAAQ